MIWKEKLFLSMPVSNRTLQDTVEEIKKETNELKQTQQLLIDSISDTHKQIMLFIESNKVSEKIAENRAEKRTDYILKGQEIIEITNENISQRIDLLSQSVNKTGLLLNDFRIQFANSREQDLDNITEQISSTKEEIQKSRTGLERQAIELLDPDLYKHAIEQWYTKQTGNIMNWDDPETYNEKIQWKKLNDRNPVKTMLADKIAVRDWISSKIGSSFLVELYGVYRKGEDIDFDSLPNSFVLKANHGSGMNLIIKDKSTADIKQIIGKANSWLKEDFSFHYGYEMHYRNIPRRLLAEEYLENSDGDMPDYKLWCFNGKVAFIEVIKNRKRKPVMGLFSTDWNKLPFTTGTYPETRETIERPKSLNKMIKVAEILAEGFDHVRVDLYMLDNGEIKFGEMTFSTSSGAVKWEPEEADRTVGKMFVLDADTSQ